MLRQAVELQAAAERGGLTLSQKRAIEQAAELLARLGRKGGSKLEDSKAPEGC